MGQTFQNREAARREAQKRNRRMFQIQGAFIWIVGKIRPKGKAIIEINPFTDQPKEWPKE
jgi:hypothetical protein